MRRKKIYAEKYVNFEYEISFNDILYIISDCNDSEITEIRKAIRYPSKTEYMIIAENLYDEQKAKVLKVAFGKYDLDELQEKLNIKNNEII